MIEGTRLFVLFGTEEERTIAATKLRYALQLLARFDPERHVRVLRDLTAVIVLRDTVAAASIDESTRVCLLSGAQIRLDKNGLATAILLVHEATHGMLLRRGFCIEACGRGRVERCCTRAQASFVRHLPEFAGKQEILKSLSVSEEETLAADYSPAARRRRLADKLREIGWPNWLVRFVART